MEEEKTNNEKIITGNFWCQDCNCRLKSGKIFKIEIFETEQTNFYCPNNKNLEKKPLKFLGKSIVYGIKTFKSQTPREISKVLKKRSMEYNNKTGKEMKNDKLSDLGFDC